VLLRFIFKRQFQSFNRIMNLVSLKCIRPFGRRTEVALGQRDGQWKSVL
jgi:hypothetical protein